jgi:predicted cupin superfamily sugar epimerase
MHPRAEALVEHLEMLSHPEGGYFREIYRSAVQVVPSDGRPARPALTTIAYLLVKGQLSPWHRVASDEAWHHYEGDPLELTWIDAVQQRVVRRLLGPVAGDQVPMVVVPAGCWQSERSLGAYTLVGCTVAPGFVYEDWELLSLGAPHRRDAPGQSA